tara:strand:- start:1330 stop:1587 length:258 start_codon:yes stop_codon:yes gene_type:complete
MASLWLSDECTVLKSYGATVRGPKAIVRIELEVNDPGALGFLLEDLGRVKGQLGPAPGSSKKGRKSAQVEHRELLAIPDFREGRR